MKKIFFSFLFAIVLFFCVGCHNVWLIKNPITAHACPHQLPRQPFWLIKNPVTAHALGGVEDREENLCTYTNSYEAFEKSYKAGIRCFECDIDYTSDEIPVLCHDWSRFRDMLGDAGNGGGMTYSSFSSSLLSGCFHPLSLSSMVDLMIEHSDIYLDIDFGGKDPSVAVELIKKSIERKRKLKDRFIIEIYSFEDYKKIDSIYHFQNYLFTESLYNGGAELTNLQRNEIIAFCTEKKISVVAVFAKFLTHEIIETYKSHGISVVAYGDIANSTEDFGKLKEIGCAGIQSDFVTPSDWNNYGK